MRDTPWGRIPYIEYKQKVEFGEEEFDEIDAYCEEKEIEWFASSWDVKSQKFLRQYELKYNKVASPMLTNQDLLEEIAKEGKYTFISTGMSTEGEIRQAVELFREKGCPFELMHCNSSYPMDNEEANLKTIETLKDKFNCDVGYSGHEKGLQISLAAVALGATSLERHITLDRAMWGSDQAASVEPQGLRKLVRDVRVVEKALGDGKIRIYESEKPAREKLRG